MKNQEDFQLSTLINQILEKIFMVCILTGEDAEDEFQKGRQFAQKLVSGVSDPKKWLYNDSLTESPEDRAIKLVKQYLPEPRVVNNFPEFQAIMDRMVRIGIVNSSEPNTYTEKVCAEKICNDKACVESQGADSKANMEGGKKAADLMVNNSIASQKRDGLKKVIRRLFPNKPIYWNKIIMNQVCLAQVDDLLIFLQPLEDPLTLKRDCNHQKVLVLSEEDLLFPRRLEREIRRIQRI